MTLDFVKCSSFGNDFLILVIPHKLTNTQLSSLARRYCDRHNGVGADGLLTWEIDRKAMILDIFNADGTKASMCGNGIRAVATWWREQFENPFPLTKVVTEAGTFSIKWQQRAKVLAIGWPKIPVKLETFKWQNYTVELWDSGVPHAVILLNKTALPANWQALSETLVKERDCNVDWVSVKPDGFILNTYERGVGPTLACGTGSVAAAMAIWQQRGVNTTNNAALKVNYASQETATVLLEKGQVYLAGATAKIICWGILF